ncbi:MAG: DUF2892 domain-containing protein [Acidimicrobiia bacterium]|nr:DUF2892 domain-containing protein [Acidimicrobiia bacterium]MDH5288552.1 DUF2892 domain-containing protein [Acidimicrobiia bacterium]
MVNEAGWDRAARVVLGVVLLVVGVGVMGGTAGTAVGIIGLVPLLTGLSGWCPLYSLAKFRTNRAPSDAAAR